MWVSSASPPIPKQRLSATATAVFCISNLRAIPVRCVPMQEGSKHLTERNIHNLKQFRVPSMFNTATCRRLCVTYRRVSDWMIRFIDTLYKLLRAIGNYRAIAHLHTLQFTVTQALGSSVFTSRILATNL
jgi:hypothetical protein